MPSSYASGDHCERFIRQQIELEEYRAKIREGMESPAVPAEEVFARLEAKYQAMFETRA